MRKVNAILAGAVAGLGLISTAQALPIVSTRLELFNISDVGVVGATPIPQISGVYQLTAGQHFIVQLDGHIVPPANRTGAQHTTAAVKNKPLGIGNLGADIRSSAPGIVSPVSTAGGQNPGSWVNYADVTPDGFGAPSTSVTDRNGDGTLDVASAGFNDVNLTTGTSATSLKRVQYGVSDSESGAPAFDDGTASGTGAMALVNGEYQALAAGNVNLVTVFISGNIYSDAANLNDVQQSPIPAGDQQNDTVSIHVTGVPEPTSLGLLGLGGLALARRRRASK